MALDTVHIIKSGDVKATGASRPDPSVLLSSFKISADRVTMEHVEKKPPRPAPRGRLLQSEEAAFAGAPVEIHTRRMEEAALPRPKQGDRNPDESEADAPSIEEIEAQWNERLEQAVAAAKDDGFREGQRAIRSETEAHVDALRESFVQELAGIQRAWESHLKESRIQLVQLAFRVARVVLDTPLPADVRRISETSLRDAIDGMADDVPVEIILHPVSYLHLQEAGINEQLLATHSKLRWRSDPDLKENEWIVQSSRSAVRRLEAELLEQLQRELSLRDLDLNESLRDDDTNQGGRTRGGSRSPHSSDDHPDATP